jgi:protein-disulfide isomerase/uncharacterized membrane protein
MAPPKKARGRRPGVGPLSAFRPVLDRVVFGLALAGLLVTAHLYIQQGRGFDRGCLGFSEPSAASAGCSIVTQSEASTLFGVSNAVWGFAFYLVVAALSLALPFVARARQAPVKRLRAALIAFGFLYSLYLVYVQAAEIGEFCVLCLTSASVVAALFITQVVDYLRPPQPATAPPAAMPSVPPRRVPREALVLGSLAVVVVFLIGADFAYFGGLAKATPPPGSPVLEANADGTAEDCIYDPEYDAVEDYQALITAMDPVKGNPEAPVTVMEFFDVNCPHCRTLYPILEQLVAQHGQQAKFVYKPFVIWQHSVAQTAALYAAGQEGKFFEMLQLQFANQQPSGLSAEQLRGMATSLGLNADVVMQRIQSGMYMSVLQLQRRHGEQIGLKSVPTLLINGRVVGRNAKTPECLSQLITAAAAG